MQPWTEINKPNLATFQRQPLDANGFGSPVAQPRQSSLSSHGSAFSFLRFVGLPRPAEAPTARVSRPCSVELLLGSTSVQIPRPRLLVLAALSFRPQTGDSGPRRLRWESANRPGLDTLRSPCCPARSANLVSRSAAWVCQPLLLSRDSPVGESLRPFMMNLLASCNPCQSRCSGAPGNLGDRIRKMS